MRATGIVSSLQYEARIFSRCGTADWSSKQGQESRIVWPVCHGKRRRSPKCALRSLPAGSALLSSLLANTVAVTGLPYRISTDAAFCPLPAAWIDRHSSPIQRTSYRQPSLHPLHNPTAHKLTPFIHHDPIVSDRCLRTALCVRHECSLAPRSAASFHHSSARDIACPASHCDQT